ncbi:MAG TPA: c-type cytochrome [Terracidiphilus sp.]|nr:c-type cytochrome [Terracidiphilus sp.]
MKPSSVFVSLAASIAMAAVFSAPSSNAQSGQEGSGNAPPVRVYPSPTNLKVLPKNLTGAQVRGIMHQWESELGVECETCHVRDPQKLGPNGKPQFDYANDAKPEKAAARVMYAMVEDINSNYIAKIEGLGLPVSCGTCHRGRISPEPFSADAENRGAEKK